MSVPLVALGQILTLGLSPVAVSPSSTYPMIGVLNTGRGVFQQPDLQGSKTSYKSLFQVSEGQVIYSKLKAFEGSIAIVPRKFDGHFVSSEFPAFDVRGVWPSYLMHVLHSEQFTFQMRRASHGLGARRERMHPRDFLQIEIPLPPLSEQHAIAARIDSLTAQAEKAQLLIDGMPHFGAQIPKWVEGELRQTQFGKVPAKQLYSVVNDLVRPGEDPSPAARFVGLENVESHTGRQLGESSIENLTGRKFRFQAGDVLFGYLRPYQNKVWVSDGAGLCSVEQFVLRPSMNVDPDLLGWALRAKSTLDAAIANTNNLQLPRLRASQLADTPIYDVRGGTPDLLSRLESIAQSLTRAQALSVKRQHALKALPQAARNAEFARLMS